MAALLQGRKATGAEKLTRIKGVRAFDRISEQRGASFTASAYRYVQLSGERIAIVWSERGEAKWAKGSEELYRRVLDGPLAPETFAAQVFRGVDIPDGFDRDPATAWFEDKNMRDDATILEAPRKLRRAHAALDRDEDDEV